MNWYTMLLSWLFVVSVHFCEVFGDRRPPVLFVHGIGGTQMEARLNRSHASHFFCFTKSDWYVIWLNVGDDVLAESCFVDNFKMVYDTTTDCMKNQEGVEIRCRGPFGSTAGVEFLDDNVPLFSNYLFPIIDDLVKSLKYSRGDNLFSVPYDFRDIGDNRVMQRYFQRIKDFIEKIASSTNSPVILVSHSLGSPLVAHFLKVQTSVWKDQYVDSWYSIAGAFGGSLKAVETHLTGFTFGLPKYLTVNDDVRNLVTSMSSTYFLFPSPDIFNKSQVAVFNSTHAFTIENLLSLVTKHNSVTFPVLKHIPPIFSEKEPGVHTVCVHGTGYMTLRAINYSGEIGRSTPTYEYGDGDSTILAETSKACMRWSHTNSKPVETTTLSKGHHLHMLQDPRLISHFRNFVKSRFKIVAPKVHYS